jgi:FKBP-type peptidyl-prolyl cis-trans isomerase
MAGSVLSVAAACAGGGGSAASTTTSASRPVSVSPVADGDIEHTQFSASLDVNLAKMMRRTSGLYVQDLQVGTGTVAAQGRTAVLRYAGYLPNGKQFDAGEITISIGAGKVIRAWDEGVLGMRVGGRRRLIAPPHLAYGSRGAPPDIPPNAVLVFDMELTQVY